MKKILSLVLSFALILAMGSMLFSCDETNNETDTTANTADTTTTTEAVTEGATAVEHTCEFDTEAWASDDNAHWYACKTQNCNKQDQKADHAYGTPVIEQTTDKVKRTYTCEFCKHEKVEETTISSVIENEASWDQAFTNLEFVNYSIIITMTLDGESQVNKISVGADAAYYLIQDYIEYYTMKNADGTWSTYMRLLRGADVKTEYEGYVKLADNTDKYYKSTITESVLDISFAENFEKFTYNAETGEYTCADQVVAIVHGPNGEVLDADMRCFNNVIKTADGKITYIESDYKFGDEATDDKYHFRYYNIGMTEVVVPQTIIDTATEGEIDLDHWEEGSPDEGVQDNNKVEVDQGNNGANGNNGESSMNGGAAAALPSKPEN